MLTLDEYISFVNSLDNPRVKSVSWTGDETRTDVYVTLSDSFKKIESSHFVYNHSTHSVFMNESSALLRISSDLVRTIDTMTLHNINRINNEGYFPLLIKSLTFLINDSFLLECMDESLLKWRKNRTDGYKRTFTFENVKIHSGSSINLPRLNRK